ncbi:hypothetical protein ES702_03311 [subsurface metagenome]
MPEKKKIILKIGAGNTSEFKVISSTHDVEIHRIKPGNVEIRKAKQKDG